MTKRLAAFLLAPVLVLASCGCIKNPDSSGVQSLDEAPPSAASLPAVSVPVSSFPLLPPSSSVPDSSAAGGGASLSLPLQAQAGINPLTGGDAPEGNSESMRPVAVMVRGGPRAAPLRGLADADAVIEMPTQDGTTNLMALYAFQTLMPDVGPVCTIEDQFAQMALPLNAVPVHIGASQYARNLFAVLGCQTLDGVYLGGGSFWYDEARFAPGTGGHLHEYNWFTSAAGVLSGITEKAISLTESAPMLFNFTQEAAKTAETAQSLTAVFSAVAAATFTYDAQNGWYTDTFLGTGLEAVERIDVDGRRAAYTNVLILEAGIGQKADSNLLEYDFSGGAGWYFTGGGLLPVEWIKGGAAQPLRLFGLGGEEIEVRQGRSYIGFVPAGTENMSYG